MRFCQPWWNIFQWTLDFYLCHRSRTFLSRSGKKNDKWFFLPKTFFRKLFLLEIREAVLTHVPEAITGKLLFFLIVQKPQFFFGKEKFHLKKLLRKCNNTFWQNRLKLCFATKVGNLWLKVRKKILELIPFRKKENVKKFLGTTKMNI